MSAEPEYSLTPLYCLLSTLSEMWDAPWTPQTVEAAVAHVRGAVAEFRGEMPMFERMYDASMRSGRAAS